MSFWCANVLAADCRFTSESSRIFSKNMFYLVFMAASRIFNQSHASTADFGAVLYYLLPIQHNHYKFKKKIKKICVRIAHAAIVAHTVELKNYSADFVYSTKIPSK
jgi:hypothetical protein